MRTLIASMVMLTTIAGAAPARAEPMTDRDRQHLLAHLDMTESWLLTELDGLSPQQLKYRTRPGRWTIMEVAEHLAVGDSRYWQRFQDSMKQQPTGKSGISDADILWYGIDRTDREQAVQADLPTGRWDDDKAAVAEFRKLRKEMREFAETTQEDLRAHRLVNGSMDAYQWFLMISAHTQRHILQIREIKANPGYPKE
ncbi:MAG: DUF664 domain-containing protein [Luteitalea sp.]|nr:DUF664 domain-containing protein [Luteitalea sp.]